MVAVLITVFILTFLLVVVIFLRAQRKGKFNKALLLFKNERYEDAIKLFEDLQVREPREKIFNWYLGQCSEKLNNYERALTEYNMVLLSKSLKPPLKEVDVHERIASVNLKLGDDKKAEQAYKMIISLDPENAMAYYQLGDIARNNGEYERAIDYLDKAVKFKNNFPEAYLNLGKLCYYLGKYERARKSLIEAMNQNPSLTEAHYYLALILENDRIYEKSIEEFQYALQEERFKFESYVHLGSIHMELSNREIANEYFEKAIETGTPDAKDMAEAKYRYTSHLIKSGDINKALQMLKEVVSLHPHYKDADSRLELYGEISKSANLLRFITTLKSDFLQTGISICKILKIKVERYIFNRDDFIEFIGSYKVGREEIICVVDLARWTTLVGEIPIRELLERMSEVGASRGIFVTASHFLEKASDLSKVRPIELYDRDKLEKLLEKVYQ